MFVICCHFVVIVVIFTIDMDRSLRLRESARVVGLCDEWYSSWDCGAGADELISMYKRGIDFCIEKRWPSDDDVLSMFSDDELRRNGVYYRVGNETVMVDGVCVFNDGCDCTCIVKDFSVVTAYVIDSKVRFECGLGAVVQIRLYDGSHASVSYRGGLMPTCICRDGCSADGDCKIIKRK